MTDPAQTGQVLDDDDDFAEFETDNWTEREANYNQPGLWDSGWEGSNNSSTQNAVAQQIRTAVAAEAEKKE